MYLMTRAGSRVRFEYKSKLPGKDTDYYGGIRKNREKCRRLLDDVKKQILFLRRTLQGKELSSVS